MSTVPIDAHSPKAFTEAELDGDHMSLALSDSQLAVVMATAASLPVERRGGFLERMAAGLRGAGAEFELAVQMALQDLMQAPAA